MEFIDEYLKNGDDITEYFIRDLHSLTVAGLKQEGDRTPGAYRQHNVSIAQSDHLPPDPIRVSDYMSELTAFINRADKPKYSI